MSGRALILCICVAGAAGMGQLGWSGVGLNANDLLGAEVCAPAPIHLQCDCFTPLPGGCRKAREGLAWDRGGGDDGTRGMRVFGWGRWWFVPEGRPHSLAVRLSHLMWQWGMGDDQVGAAGVIGDKRGRQRRRVYAWQMWGGFDVCVGGLQLRLSYLLCVQGACSRGGAAAASGSPMRLRGGAAAAVASKGPDLGEWKGRNVGPHAKRLLRTRTSAIASIHVQARFVIDCGRPHADNLLNVEELLTYLQDNIKVQNIRGNLGPRKRAEPQDRITVQIEKVTRIVVTSRVRLSKKYIKWLVKKYLYGRGMRNFMWCVMGSKHSYQLR